MKAFWVDKSPTIPVYIVEAEGLNGPVVWDNFEDALQEKNDLKDEGYTVSFRFEEMTQWEFDNLEEFEGY